MHFVEDTPYLEIKDAYVEMAGTAAETVAETVVPIAVEAVVVAVAIIEIEMIEAVIHVEIITIETGRIEEVAAVVGTIVNMTVVVMAVPATALDMGTNVVLTIFDFFNAAVIDIMSHTYPEIRMKLVLRHLDTNQHLSLRTMVVAVAVTTDMVHHRPEKLMGLILVTQGDEYSRNVREQIRVFVSTY